MNVWPFRSRCWVIVAIISPIIVPACLVSFDDWPDAVPSRGGAGFSGTSTGGQNGGGAASGGVPANGGAAGGGNGSIGGSAGAAICNDGIRQSPEQCDGSDLGGKTCATIGLGQNGSLGCTDQCVLDTSACAPILVLFGGAYSAYRTDVLGDTWEYSQKTWKQVAVAGPYARSNAGIVSSGKGVLLFGGYDSLGYFGDSWLWDGKTWTQVVGLTSQPSPRHGPAMARLGDQVILFGGWGSTGHLDDTWSWDGDTWTELYPEHRPFSSDGATLANLGGDRLVLFGGKTGGTVDAGFETFEWDPDKQDWLALSVTPHPLTPRWYIEGATWGGTVLLFGGVTGQATPNTVYGDTWLWNGSSWSLPSLTGSPPPARYYYAAGPTGSGVVVFGGCGVTGSLLSDTWEFDGTKWAQNPTPVPSTLGPRMYVQFAAR